MKLILKYQKQTICILNTKFPPIFERKYGDVYEVQKRKQKIYNSKEDEIKDNSFLIKFG